MSTKYSVLATVAFFVVWLTVMGVAGASIISSSRSDAEIRRRGSELGGPAGLALAFCISPIWIWWAQSRRASAARENEEEDDRPRRKRRPEQQDGPKSRRRRADSGSGAE